MRPASASPTFTPAIPSNIRHRSNDPDMKQTRASRAPRHLLHLLITTVLLSSLAVAADPTPATLPTKDQVQERDAFVIGYQAYMWGFTYVKSMLLRDEAINPAYHGYAPINSLRVEDQLARPGFTDFAPNNDTLYGLGWLDLSQGPILMTVPDMTPRERYWVIQATDYGLNTLDYVGSRVGSRPGVYAYVHRTWQGELPAGVTKIVSPSNVVFLQLRTFVYQDIEGDLQEVVRFNRGFRFTPLNKQASYPPVPPGTPIRDPKVSNPALHNLQFFELLNEAVTREAPLPGEEAVYSFFAPYGIGPGLTFDAGALSASQRKGLLDGMAAAVDSFVLDIREAGDKLGGFNFRYGVGRYVYNFPFRGMAGYMGYGGNAEEEALYNFAFFDSDNEPLHGGQRYRLHFARDQFPPVEAFWSLTAYTFPGSQLEENAIGRYNINTTLKDLQYGEDGSLTLYIQHDRPPAHLVSNWLPSPAAGYFLILRCYVPGPELLDKRYQAPFVEKLSD
jgi:hypothetical protein